MLYDFKALIPEKQQRSHQNRYPINPFGGPYPKGVYKGHFEHDGKVNNVNSHHRNLYAQGNIYITHTYNAIVNNITERHEYKYHKNYRHNMYGLRYKVIILLAGENAYTEVGKNVNNEA